MDTGSGVDDEVERQKCEVSCKCKPLYRATPRDQVQKWAPFLSIKARIAVSMSSRLFLGGRVSWI